MPKILTLLLPVLYALVGGILWYTYGAEWYSIVAWVIMLFGISWLYKWLIADRDLGLMLKFHLVSSAIGMLILFYVLFPGRVQEGTNQLVLEFGLMGFGTFCCAIGLFSLLYMTVRKFISDSRTN